MPVNKFHVEISDIKTNSLYGILVNTTDESSAIKIAKQKIKEQYGIAEENIKCNSVKVIDCV